MRGPKALLESEDRWVTDMGAWFPGERVVFRGKDLFRDLAEWDWMSLLLYGITGRDFTDKQVRLLESLWITCISYPDPRLWNNRVAALAGTTRSTATLAISGANAVSEATIYGHRPIIGAIDFLLRTRSELDKGGDLVRRIREHLKENRHIPGYGRPVVRRDERIEPLMLRAEKLGFADGRHVKLAFAVERILLQGRWRLHMNIAAVAAGLAADQGLTPNEYYQFLVLGFSAGMFPCYADATSHPEGSFFPLRCDRLVYKGKPHRRW